MVALVRDETPILVPPTVAKPEIKDTRPSGEHMILDVPTVIRDCNIFATWRSRLEQYG